MICVLLSKLRKVDGPFVMTKDFSDELQVQIYFL